MGHVSNEMIERRADSLLAGKTRAGAALRDAASRRSLKIGIVSSLALGLADSFNKMAQVEQRSVSKTGVGYKAWLGAGLLATGALAGSIAEDTKTDAKFKQAEMVADAALNLADTVFSIESYNLGVTRFRRVKNAVASLTGQPTEPVEVTGIPSQAYRPGLPARVAGLAQFAGRRVIKRIIDPNSRASEARILEIFGIDEETQEELFGAFSGGNEDELLPVEG